MTGTAQPPRDGPDPIQVWLELDLVARPIRGTLSLPAGSPSPFVGWLGLAAAIEGLRPR